MIRKNKVTGKGRHFVYLIAASGMLFYALSQLERNSAEAGSNLFWYVWLAFTAIIMAANINMLLFMNEQKRRELARIKRAKSKQLEQAVEKGLSKYRSRKRGVRGE